MSDTRSNLRLMPPLTPQTRNMTKGRNAGIKRNRRPTGTIAVERKIYVDPALVAAFDEARRASGNLSLSLYIELLAQQLESELGALPVLSPPLNGTEVPTKAAA